MPIAYKTLGQSAPSATTATTLYTVPSATQAVASTLSVCNRASTSATYRIAVRPGGAALANQHYVAYDAALPGNATDTLTLGLALGAADVVTVYASSANLSFGLFGAEVT